MSGVTLKFDAIVVEGGDLTEPWVLQQYTCDGGEYYFKITSTDRKLAAFCGANRSLSHPLQDCDFFRYLANLRDKEMWRMTKELVPKELRGKPRGELREYAPKSVVVSLPYDGFADTSIKMLTSETSQENPTIHLTANALALVREGIRRTFENPKRGRRSKGANVLYEQYPDVKEYYDGKRLKIEYKDPDGRKHQLSEKIPTSDVPEIFMQNREKVAEQLQSEYDQLERDGLIMKEEPSASC